MRFKTVGQMLQKQGQWSYKCLSHPKGQWSQLSGFGLEIGAKFFMVLSRFEPWLVRAGW